MNNILSLYPIVFRKLLFPGWNFFKRETDLAALKQLRHSQWFSEEEIQMLQLKRLRILLEHAYHNCAYYRSQMQKKYISVPLDNFQLKDLSQLPILTKSIIQKKGHSLIASNYSEAQLFKNASGGSTGQPTIVYQDHFRRAVRQADAIRHNEWTGWRHGEKVAILWGADRDIFDPVSFRDRIRNICTENAFYLNAFELNRSKCIHFVNLLNRECPKLLIGYAGALTRLAQIIDEEKIDISKISINLKGIVSSAEMLTDDSRQLIEKIFNVKVFDRYGSREVGLIASECEMHNGLHINAEHVLVEVVTNGEPASRGQIGDIIVTDLMNFGMPIIRYKLGDRAALLNQQCQCGRGLPLMSNVIGRISDFFIAKDGSEIHGEYFTHLFYGFSKIQQFQFIQNDINVLEVKIVSKERLTDKEAKDIINKCKKKLGNIDVRIHYVEQIPPSASGKYLFTISNINR